MVAGSGTVEMIGPVGGITGGTIGVTGVVGLVGGVGIYPTGTGTIGGYVWSGGQLSEGVMVFAGTKGAKAGISKGKAGNCCASSPMGGASANGSSAISFGLYGGIDSSRAGGCNGVVFGFGVLDSRFPQRVRA